MNAVFLLAFILMIFLVVLARGIHKLLSRKLKWRILIVYVSVLVLATGAYFMLQPRFITQNNVVEKPFIPDVLKQSNGGEIPQKYEVTSWEIALENQSLFLDTAAKFDGVDFEEPTDLYVESDVYIPVLVKQGEVEKAHVTVYETPTTLKGIDISDHVAISTVDVTGNHVIVTPTPHSTTNFHSIRNDVTLYQFSDRRSMLGIHYDLDIGEVGLVITVPKGTKVEADSEYFDIIE